MQRILQLILKIGSRTRPLLSNQGSCRQQPAEQFVGRWHQRQLNARETLNAFMPSAVPCSRSKRARLFLSNCSKGLFKFLIFRQLCRTNAMMVTSLASGQRAPSASRTLFGVQPFLGKLLRRIGPLSYRNRMTHLAGTSEHAPRLCHPSDSWGEKRLAGKPGQRHRTYIPRLPGPLWQKCFPIAASGRVRPSCSSFRRIFRFAIELW
jgi:hypothetical protein